MLYDDWTEKPFHSCRRYGQVLVLQDFIHSVQRLSCLVVLEGRVKITHHSKSSRPRFRRHNREEKSREIEFQDETLQQSPLPHQAIEAFAESGLLIRVVRGSVGI